MLDVFGKILFQVEVVACFHEEQEKAALAINEVALDTRLADAVQHPGLGIGVILFVLLDDFGIIQQYESHNEMFHRFTNPSCSRIHCHR